MIDESFSFDKRLDSLSANPWHPVESPSHLFAVWGLGFKDLGV